MALALTERRSYIVARQHAKRQAFRDSPRVAAPHGASPGFAELLGLRLGDGRLDAPDQLFFGERLGDKS